MSWQCEETQNLIIATQYTHSIYQCSLFSIFKYFTDWKSVEELEKVCHSIRLGDSWFFTCRWWSHMPWSLFVDTFFVSQKKSLPEKSRVSASNPLIFTLGIFPTCVTPAVVYLTCFIFTQEQRQPESCHWHVLLNTAILPFFLDLFFRTACFVGCWRWWGLGPQGSPCWLLLQSDIGYLCVWPSARCIPTL